MAAKKTQSAKAKERELRNPLTGQAPNSFTQATNRDLPEPTNVREPSKDLGLQRRTRKAADEHLRGHASDAPMGYRLDGISEEYRTFVTGANHMFPNRAKERGVPAINEPHEADPGVTVQRRAEDLSGKEYRKGAQTLAQYGHDPKDPVGSLKKMQGKALDHTVAQHIAAGTQESSSQMFYGGTPTTTDMDHDLDSLQRHESGVMASHDRFREGVNKISQHPGMRDAIGHLSPREQQDASTRLMAQATADTSPNTKWRDSRKDGSDSRYPWPNMQQAEEATVAAVEMREPKFISGRIGNIHKAADRVGHAIDNKDFNVHQYGNPRSAAKTVAFRGALVDKDAADAYKVTDVHEASVVAPWLSTAKAHMHARVDEEGEQVGPKVHVYADTPKAHRTGLKPLTKTTGGQGGEIKTVPQWGVSRPEAMLQQGGSTVHALNDYATRSVLAERGLSRGVEYADNAHAMQGATWGMQQMRRKDVNVSPADQYPVTRQWEREGINVPADGDIRNMGSAKTNLSRQFDVNDRRGRTQTIWPEDR